MSCARWMPMLMACLWLAAGHAARADQNDQRLPPLFDRLRQAASDAEASAIVARIWSIWDESGDARADALFETGTNALAEQDGKRALAAFSEVVSLAPDFAEGWNKRATALYLLGRFEESEADIARVLDLEPRHFGALSGLGLCETGRDRLPQALAAFQQALTINPHMPNVEANIRMLKAEIAKRTL